MSQDKKKTWKCEECKLEETSVASSRQEADASSNAVLAAIERLDSKMDARMKSLEDQLKLSNENFKKLQDAVDNVSADHENLKAECAELKTKTSRLEEETRGLRRDLHDMQQYSRRDNLEVAGVPQTNGEDVYQVLSAIAEALDVDFNRSDISVAHRVPARRRNCHPHIVVKFISRSAREVWLAAGRARRRLSTADLGPGLPPGHVYVNEHLTPFNKMLLSRGKALVRDKRLAYAWAREGKVLIKKTPDSASVRVFDLEDLNN